ncbi:NlpC/P60 family protein [Winogradskyella maritima]|uniref:C40 family peptidase n=1 Tax=Winogradskyella maritima TaxID=1517766 RepID=A0ABV8AJW3_9FLAO|nr:NlpC/P60 family protein [Winogradskyella maritima]
MPQNLKSILFACLALTLFMSCGASKRNKVVVKKSRTETSKPTTVEPSSQAEDIIDVALSYEGTRYKYGGTTKKGMDCSGLIYTSFKSKDILMPRTTTDLSSHGDWVDVKKVIPGDLVFFATRKNSRKVNHVGIVTEVSSGDFSFIHASSSRGVMVSKLSDTYWYKAYVQARRVL